MMEEKKEGSMVTNWNNYLERQKQIEEEKAMATQQLNTNQRIAYALERIASLLEIQTEILIKTNIDPDMELTFVDKPMFPDESTPSPENIIENEEMEYPEEPDVPPVSTPDSLEGEDEAENYVKELVNPFLKDDVLAKTEITFGGGIITIRFPWLGDNSYEEGMAWRDLAERLRNNNFEWISDGRNSHWKAEFI